MITPPKDRPLTVPIEPFIIPDAPPGDEASADATPGRPRLICISSWSPRKTKSGSDPIAQHPKFITQENLRVANTGDHLIVRELVREALIHGATVEEGSLVAFLRRKIVKFREKCAMKSYTAISLIIRERRD